MGDLLPVIFKGLHVFQVTYMLTWKNIVLLGKAEAGLLLGAAGQYHAPAPRYLYREGHVAPGPSGLVLHAVQHPAEGVVTAGLNLPVMEQETVRNAPELLHRLGVFKHDWRIGEVCAGHNQHVHIVAEKQIVQRRIGQHDAHSAVFADMGKPGLPLFQQHDGAAKAGEDCFFLRGDKADLFCRLRVPAHNGKGLFIPLLAAAESLCDLLIVAAAGQMHPAQALDSDDLPALQGLSCQFNGVAGLLPPLGVQEKYPGPTVRTAVRLGVVAAVFNVVIFPVAVRAHGKGAHRGLGPVIGYVFDNGKPGAAVGAVDKRVAVAPVLFVPQLPQAVVTDADIRGDEGIAKFLGLAFADLKIRKTGKLSGIADVHALDHGQLGCSLGQFRCETLQRFPIALQLQLHAGGGILNKAAQPVLAHQPVDKGPEAYALNDAVYADQSSFQALRPFVS